MTLQSSGAISLSQVNTELGLPSTALISLNDTIVRTLFGVSSGSISFSNGYGKSFVTYSMTQQAQLQASDTAASDSFGVSVAISADGNTAVVGSHKNDTTIGTNYGSIYVFTRSGTAWTEQAQLFLTSQVYYFGSSVAISADGNTIIAGSQSGAYVFTRSNNVWNTTPSVLMGDVITSYSWYGWSVDLSSDGNTAIVGSWPFGGSDGGVIGGMGIGDCYIFTRSGTTWTQQTRLNSSSNTTGLYYGCDVALSGNGNIAVIGAYGNRGTSGTNYGQVHVFTRNGTIWTEQIINFTPIVSNEYIAAFGRYVDISENGSTIIVGAPELDIPQVYTENWDILGGSDSGSAYVYTLSGSTWTLESRLNKTNQIYSSSTLFGSAVALSADGNIASIGSYSNNGNYTPFTKGAVYIFTRNGTTWTEKTIVKANDMAAYDGFGLSVAMSADGTTLLVGSKDDDTTTGGADAGSAYVFTLN